MKQNDSETESNQHFQKNVENMSAKQESVSGATFKAWPFSSIFNFACKDVRVTATCKYCLLVVSPSDESLRKFLPLPIVAKSSILNVEEFWIHLWKLCHAWKLVQFHVKPVSFLIISKCGHLYRKSLCFSLLLFTE